MRIFRRVLQLPLDAGVGIEQARGFMRCRTAAKMGLRSHIGESGIGHAQLKDAVVGVGLGQQAFRRIGALPPQTGPNRQQK